MQGAIYRGELFSDSCMWSVATHSKLSPAQGPYQIDMQGDGNLVIYGHYGYPMWTSWSKGQNNDWAVLAEDGNFFVAPNGDWSQKVWSTDYTDALEDNSLQWDSVDWDLAHATSTAFGTGVGGSVSNVARNQTDVEQSDTFHLTYEKTTSTSFKSTTTLKVGVKTSVTFGNPSIAKGSIEISGEVSQAIEGGEGKVLREAITIGVSVKIPPHKNIQARCVSHISTLSIPFKLVGTGKFKGWPNRLPKHLEGVYGGIQTYNIETSWSYVDDNHPTLRKWMGTQRLDGNAKSGSLTYINPG
jgi:hypothetical protein